MSVQENEKMRGEYGGSFSVNGETIELVFLDGTYREIPIVPFFRRVLRESFDKLDDINIGVIDERVCIFYGELSLILPKDSVVCKLAPPRKS